MPTDTTKVWYAANRDRLLEYMRTYNQKNKEAIRKQRLEHRIIHADQINERQRERYLIKVISSDTKDMSDRSASYYEKNKERIHAYYLQNKEELKQKALFRYYKKKEQQLQSGEIVAKRAGRPSNKYIDTTPPIFKIERLDKSNITHE